MQAIFALLLLAVCAVPARSRLECGVHNASAVAAGWITATAIFSAQQSSAEFRAGVDAARTELAELLKQPGADAQACSLEREALSKRPF